VESILLFSSKILRTEDGKGRIAIHTERMCYETKKLFDFLSPRVFKYFTMDVLLDV